MRKLKAFMDMGTLVSAILLILVLGSLMYTVTDFSVVNASRNGSTAITSLMLLLPMLIVVVVIVSFLKFTEAA